MRYRLIGLASVCLFSASIFAAKFSANVAGFRVNESATKFSIRKEGAVVALAFENPRATASLARINLELINPGDVVRATAMREISVPPGSSVFTTPLIKLGSGDYDDKELLWYRLRYQIVAADPSGEESSPVSGVISLSEITPDIFRLLVSAPQEAGKEPKYTIRVRTLHPLTGHPIAGVNVEAWMSYEEGGDERKLRTSGVTNSIGESLLEFKFLGPLKAEDAEIKVVARRDGFYQEAEEEISLLYPNQVLVSADKPLYQPGQVLHARILGFDRDRKAWANVEGTLKIRDPEGSYIFRAGFKTSRFGAASVDWPIADNARLGEYYIEAWLGEESPRNAPGGVSFKISRYDLPNFVVNVKPDRGYYLPGQNAEVEVRADYLFGQPVKRGRARVVRETERRWNYREQKWETEEGAKYEGALDDEGRFIARVNLAEEHEDFKPDSYSRFRDLRFAAYLTDLTTGRTEQRRFDLRITAEPIHVYLIERGRNSEGLPLQFYVSTFYADGSPAQCEVAISQTFDDEDDSKAKRDDAEQALATVKTNRYGVAKVSSLDAGKTERNDDLRVKLTARDAQGRSGRDVHEHWDRYSAAMRVETDKTLYRMGEPIKARLTSNSPRVNWIVDLMRGSRLLATRAIQLKDGRAEIAFPFDREFSDELMIIAYPAFIDDYESHLSSGAARILYPRDRELKLDVKFDQVSYRPGEEARADLRVLTPQGRAAESALGVVIFDKAIEERARTDQEFSGRGFGFYDCFRGLLGLEQTLSGVTRRDLDRLDLSKPPPDDLELVAEILLNQQDYGYYRPEFFGGDEFETDAEEVFKYAISAQLSPVGNALDSSYGLKSVYPANEAALRRLMLLAGIELDEMRDPWGAPYRAKFSIETTDDVFELISAGPDKRFDTDDDFTALRKPWQYFRHTASAIARTVESYHAQTGGFIRDRETLKRELMSREAVDLDALRDRWGNPCRFEFGIEQRSFSIRARSGGPNGRFEDERERRQSDDFTLSTCLIDYTAEPKARINRALTAHFKKTGLIPRNDPELREALKQSGVDFDELRDGWGNRYYASFKTTSHYSDRVTQFNQARRGEKPKPKTEITPVTRQIARVIVRGVGADGKAGTYDDFDVSDFSQIVAEESAKQSAEKIAEKIAAQTKPKAISFSGEGGAIAGTVIDAQGASILDVAVTAKHTSSGAVWTAKTNNDGAYLLSNLAPGIYEVRFDAMGFKASVFTDVAVYSSRLTRVDATLEVGTVSEAVMVEGSSSQLSTESTAVAVTRGQIQELPLNSRGLLRLKDGFSIITKSAISTPRLREYFPETLLWQPQIETDKQGRAQLKFKLADNITTWKMSVVGSTVDGEIGIAEKEFRAFQPFFAEHDPPKVLTEGDEIALPVVLRNYLDKTQAVSAEIKPESWFELLSAARKRVEVKAGDAGQVIFDFRAVASVKDGRQRVTAFGSDASDAVEKPVSVHPDGEEVAQIASDVFTGAGSLDISVPMDAIKGSMRAELKIYPNLMAHALEGVEGILQRPYGCGEQTISSTYPNVMILRYLEPQSEKLSAPMRKVAEKARRYAQAGYERLLGYRAESGGFSYWGRGEADLALTAYALRFLNDVRDFTAVDEEVMAGARKFILSRQQFDGRWIARSWGGKEDAKRTALNTAFIARVLAAEKKAMVNDKIFAAALSRALDYLAKRSEEIDEPYLIASYALAALDAGENARAGKAVATLRTLAREDAGTSYWHLESNTPFYGWGLAGRIETTALAVNALKRDGAKNEELVNRGLLFLLRNKDRYGVWLSTQATINVLDTLISLNEADVVEPDAAGDAEIIVNGKRAASVTMPPGGQLGNPITVDLSSFLSRGTNRVEIRRPGNAARASAQLVETHYELWEQGAAGRRENFRLRNSSALRLAVSYDKPQAQIGEEVTCNVAAERIGHQGDGQMFGMMLAEIGLPPGADVDRASLEAAAKASGWALNHFDILPDRVIVYLWPRAGGVKFSFKFKPRYGVKAQTSSSTLYDYYNPEARVVIAPTRFVVR